MDPQKILESYLNQMQAVHKEFSGAKKGLLQIMLVPFESLFAKDRKGNYVASNLSEKDKQEVIKAFNDELLPTFEENKYKEGIEQINEWKKLLEEN